jgi:hypothetical protein
MVGPAAPRRADQPPTPSNGYDALDAALGLLGWPWGARHPDLCLAAGSCPSALARGPEQPQVAKFQNSGRDGLCHDPESDFDLLRCRPEWPPAGDEVVDDGPDLAADGFDLRRRQVGRDDPVRRRADAAVAR